MPVPFRPSTRRTAGGRRRPLAGDRSSAHLRTARSRLRLVPDPVDSPAREASSPLPHDFAVRTRQGSRAFVVAVHGELDLATTPELRAALELCDRSRQRQVVIDLGALTFIDCAGIGVLVDFHRRVASDGRDLLILPGHRRTARLFELTGTTATLPFLP